ncbi:sigma factor G inhibitor Gin [Brevibacillus daliensis]|uniref:sigma factor G inhibitor Gin n=1 Tax=Brevibacillus daliensis TaxID=2892995 RepID=UPI001E482AE5|nr:sigma factor G inhibitor Gin [Brevibacillus daliensis]
MEKHSHCCIICNEERSIGIAICNQFICDGCEQEMVKTDAQDERYPYYIKQLKRIWLKKNA